MPPLRIPREAAKGLIELRTLDEQMLRDLITAFTEMPPIMQHQKLATLLSSKLTTISPESVAEIAQTLIGMSSARLDLDAPISEFVGSVCEAMEQSDDDQLRLAGEDCESFKGRLTELLSLEPLLYPAKGFSVLYDRDHVFLNARTLTDIRSVFGSDIKEPPKAAAIVHMLNIAYRQNDSEKNFYIAMDSQDVTALIEVLQRALAKTESLKSLLSSASITYLSGE